MNFTRTTAFPGLALDKLPFVMKITALFLVLVSIHLSLWAHAQTRISLSVKKEPLSNVLSLIEQKSGYRFLYEYKAVFDTKEVSLQVKDALLEDVLSQIL